MKPFFRKRYAAFLILVLAAILAILGGLQYRSTQQVSEATARDMEANLQSSLFDFRQSLERELTGLCLELGLSSDGRFSAGPKETAKRFNLWRQTAAHPGLATEVFLWDSGSEADPVLISSTGLYKTSAWPSTLADLPSLVKRLVSDTNSTLTVGDSPPPQPSKLGGSSLSRWLIDQERLILLHPVMASVHSGKSGTVWLIVPLNRVFFSQHLLPELARSRFGGPGEIYHVAVMLDGDNQAVLYSSQPGFGNIPSAADASLRLFGPPLLVRGTFFSHMPGVVFPTLAESNTPHLFIDPVMKASNGGNLTVIAQHRKGLEAAVKDLRDRNLAMNFGILGILVLTLTLVVATSQRAQMLAQMQMDFVAGVSHELRTPLTAIILAARNLEDGVVHENGLVRYGAAIKGQAAQLSELVDEILLFSETHSGRHVYKIEAVDVTLGIQTTIENLAPLIEASGFIVEEEVSPDLPLVRADAAAFTQCLQNLISNSLKYGGEKKWVGVRAFSHETAGRGEICVSVQDRGIGIKSGELKQIFEPFYRSADVASEIHGNGLGLPLTKTMVEAMGGRLTVASEPGKGSNFTIHLRPV